jgi:membrane protein YdbS with pleckstrin-like domain
MGVVIAMIFAVYFTILYTSNSGFFTTQFTTADAVLFFGIAYLGIIPGLVRIILGHRNAVRPLDVLLSISVLAAAIWFLYTFPFDFSFVADALPSSLQFLLSWISDGLVQAIMVFAIIASVFIIPYTALLYLGVRQKLAIKKGG